MLLEGYRDERLMYKSQARTDSEAALKSNVYKILINAAYGYLGFQFAKYGNLQAAELVTRYGRYTLTRCIEIAKQLGWDIIYSDTDSVFSRGEITEEQKNVFIDTCKKELNVTMELDKVFEKIIMTGKKNYIGIQRLPNGEKKAVIVGMSGIKSNQCGWVKNAFLQMVEDYKNDVNPCIKLREELDKLMSNSIPNAEFMLIKNKNLGRNPEDYSDKVNIVQKVFGAKMGLQEGDTVRYYLADKPLQWSLDLTKVSKKAYREQLLKTTTPVLRLLGYDTKKEFVKPPRVVLSLSDISKRKKKNKAPKKDILKIENDSDNSSVVTVTEIKEQSKQLTLEDATEIESIVALSKGKSAEISLSKLAMIPKTKKRGKLVQI